MPEGVRTVRGSGAAMIDHEPPKTVKGLLRYAVGEWEAGDRP